MTFDGLSVSSPTLPGTTSEFDDFPPEDIERFSTFVTNGGEIIRRFDERITEWITIPIGLPEGVTRRSLAELKRMSRSHLILEAQQRGLIPETENPAEIKTDKKTLYRDVFNSQRVPVIFGTAQPEFANRERTLRREDGDADKSLNYPFITVARTRIEPDSERLAISDRRVLAWTENGNQVLTSSQPTPIILTYDIEIQSLYQNQINDIDAGILRAFAIRDNWQFVNLGDPWGEKLIRFDIDGGYSDSSELEGSFDRARRVYRHMYTVQVWGWLPDESQAVRSVRNIDIEIDDNQNPGVCPEIYEIRGYEPEAQPDGEEGLITKKMKLTNASQITTVPSAVYQQGTLLYPAIADGSGKFARYVVTALFTGGIAECVANEFVTFANGHGLGNPGDRLFLSTTTPGAITTVEPPQGEYVQELGQVVNNRTIHIDVGTPFRIPAP